MHGGEAYLQALGSRYGVAVAAEGDDVDALLGCALGDDLGGEARPQAAGGLETGFDVGYLEEVARGAPRQPRAAA